MKKTETRRTITISAPYAAQTPGLYTHMFIEDIHSGLMGFRYRSEEDQRQIHVEGDNEGRLSLEAICTSLADHRGSRLVENVHSAIESIALRLAWFGEAVYEIGGVAPDMSLHYVLPRRLFRVPGGFAQLLSKQESRWNKGPRYTFLPGKYSWMVALPRSLNRPRGHRRLLQQLTAVSKPAPDFWMRELEAGKFAREFMVADYNRTRDAYIARITRRWGWNRRDSSGTHDTEFFYFFRSLRFRQTQAALRDHIVGEINKFLKAQRLNAHINLKGFSTPAEIENLISAVVQGSVHYADALRQLR